MWHVAGSIFLFRWIFRDPKVDLRLLVLGAITPDLVDLIAGVFLGQPTRQRWGHALIVPSAVAVLILLTTRRGRRRRQLMTVVVAWLFHLVLDGVWIREQTFLWPFFGTDFAPWPEGPIWPRALSDPWRFLKEGLGFVYLLLLWRALPPLTGGGPGALPPLSGGGPGALPPLSGGGPGALPPLEGAT